MTKQLIIIADNLQITNQTIERAIVNYDPEPIATMVKKCEAAGAQAIDINPGPIPLNTKEKMAFLVNTIQSATDLPIVIDTANPAAICAGLKENRKKAIINGFSLEPVKLKKILPLAKRFNVEIIGYLLHPDGHVPANAHDRLQIAVEIFKACENEGIDKNSLIIDPILPPVNWEKGPFQALEVLSVIKILPELLGFPVKTVVGLSNLTAGKGERAKKLLLERTYLPMLCASGLSMVLLNMFHHETIEIAKVCNTIISKDIFTWEEI